MNRTLVGKILSRVMLVIIVCSILYTGLSYYQIQKSVTEQMKHDGVTLINTVRREIVKDQVFEFSSLQALFREITESSDGNIIYVSLSDTEFNILVSNDAVASENSTDAVASATMSEYKEDMNLSLTEVDTVSSATTTSSEMDSIGGSNVQGKIIQVEGYKGVYNVSAYITYGVDKLGVLNIGISLDNMNHSLSRVLLELILASILIAILTIIIGTISIKKITKPLESMSKKVKSFSEGDFTHAFDYRSKDEIGQMSLALEDMRVNLRELVGEVYNNSSIISDNTKSLLDVAEESFAVSEGIAKASEELATGSNDLTVNSLKGTELLNRLADEINNLADRTKHMELVIIQTNEANMVGTENILELKKAVGMNNEVNELMKEQVNLLTTKSESIVQITTVIQEIASQIELLALNAKIESARAGEAGRGFGVVAGEISKLSQATAHSVVTIDEIVGELMVTIEKTKEYMLNGAQSTELTSNVSEKTIEAFDHIDQSITNTIHDMTEVSRGIEQVNSDKDEVVEAIEGMSVIAQAATASTEEIAASLEQQTSGMEQLTLSARELEMITDKLEHLMKKFKL